MLPSPAELTYFIEVASVLNISRASERLGISQPSLSLALNRLEKTMGTSLFIRHKQGVSLTQAGKQLVLHARTLLQYWEQAKSQALASQEKVQGHFTLGCHSTIAIYLGTLFLPQLLSQHPQLEIDLKHDISRKITEEVINLSLDLGVVVNPIRHPNLVIQKLFEDEVSFWVSDPSVKYFSKDQVVLCDPDLTQAQTLLKQLKKIASKTLRIITSNSLEVVAALTAKGCGVGILPNRVVQALYPAQLHKMPDTPVYKDEICLIYRHENRHIQAVKTMIAAIIETNK